MFNIKKILSQALLALAMLGGSGAVLAGPTFHVTLNTANLGVTSGYLDFTVSALGFAGPATATLSNFSGAFDVAAQMAEGDVTGLVPGTLAIGNAGAVNEVLKLADFGGEFSFDLNFDVADGLAGSTFGVAFLNAGLTDYLGVQGSILEIFVQPGVNGAFTFALSADNEFASITAVPEPSDLLMMMTGLGLVAFVHRRRKVRAAA